MSKPTILSNSDIELPAELELRGDGSLWRAQFSAMACPCEVLVDTQDAFLAKRIAIAVSAEAWRIERKFSRYLTDNITYAINTAKGRITEVDDETARLLDFAVSLYEASAGLFDITSGALRRVWRFDGSGRLPDPRAVRELLPLIGWHRVHWRKPQLRLPPGMEIDFGGIGKEYAVDQAARLAGALGTVPLLINFGGDIVATGPRMDGTVWKVAIERVAPDLPTPMIELKSGGVATSGDARRYLLKDGVRYGHILNPRTGWPVRDAPRSVTVLDKSCTQAGALSTLAILQGRAAEGFLQTHGVAHWIIR